MGQHFSRVHILKEKLSAASYQLDEGQKLIFLLLRMDKNDQIVCTQTLMLPTAHAEFTYTCLCIYTAGVVE